MNRSSSGFSLRTCFRTSSSWVRVLRTEYILLPAPVPRKRPSSYPATFGNGEERPKKHLKQNQAVKSAQTRRAYNIDSHSRYTTSITSAVCDGRLISTNLQEAVSLVVCPTGPYYRRLGEKFNQYLRPMRSK